MKDRTKYYIACFTTAAVVCLLLGVFVSNKSITVPDKMESIRNEAITKAIIDTLSLS